MKSQTAVFVLLLGAFALFVVSTPADARGGGRGTARTSTSPGATPLATIRNMLRYPRSPVLPTNCT